MPLHTTEREHVHFADPVYSPPLPRRSTRHSKRVTYYPKPPPKNSRFGVRHQPSNSSQSDQSDDVLDYNSLTQHDTPHCSSLPREGAQNTSTQYMQYEKTDPLYRGATLIQIRQFQL